MVKWSVVVPIRVVSEMNQREHWAAKMRRKNAQQTATTIMLLSLGLSESDRAREFARGATVTMTRIGGRTMDDDNLRSAFKHCRDAVSRWIGLDDGDKRLTWEVSHRPRSRTDKGPAVEITIEARHANVAV